MIKILTTSTLLLLASTLWPKQHLATAASFESSGGDLRRTSANVAGEYIAESGFYQSLTLTSEKPIYNKESQFQNVKVVQSKYYGKVLVLDGVVQLTERDGCAYNEMMVHPAMFAHRKPKRVLIIGGGDGYVLSEVLKHPEVEHVDHVDLDSDVIDVCRNHFPWGSAWYVHLEIFLFVLRNKSMF